jgi:hypothetical protein
VIIQLVFDLSLEYIQNHSNHAKRVAEKSSSLKISVFRIDRDEGFECIPE